MSVSLLSTRQFIELTPWTERQWYQARYQYPNQFPQPVGRDKAGYLYSSKDVLPFASSIVAECKAQLDAELEAVSLRVNSELKFLEEKNTAIQVIAHGVGKA